MLVQLLPCSSFYYALVSRGRSLRKQKLKESKGQDMGKRGRGSSGDGGGVKRAANTPSKFQKTVSLREEASGKKPTRGGGSTNVKAVLKHEHLQNLAVWASREASIPSLASFFGHRLAADGEASAIPPDPSFFPCQRCETILQPGFNCTVRIEKNRATARHRRKKPHISTQNTVVYNCHFCLHRNLKRGTPEGHMKEMYPPKSKTSSSTPKVVKSRNLKPIISSGKETSKDDIDEMIVISSPAAAAAENPSTDSPLTPVRGRTLLDLKKRNRNKSGTKRPVEHENNPVPPDAEKSVGASGKRRRKSWMSLGEIVASNGDFGRGNAIVMVMLNILLLHCSGFPLDDAANIFSGSFRSTVNSLPMDSVSLSHNGKKLKPWPLSN
ncbi:hypothetical protein V6N13_142830 [Hibiscus sabdariffa]